MCPAIAGFLHCIDAAIGAKCAHIGSRLAPSYVEGGEKSKPAFCAVCPVAGRLSSEREMRGTRPDAASSDEDLFWSKHIIPDSQCVAIFKDQRQFRLLARRR